MPMKSLLIITISCLLSLSSDTYAMNCLVETAGKNTQQVDSITQLFGRVLLKLKNGKNEEFHASLEVLKAALKISPATDIDAKIMPLHPRMQYVSMRTYYKAVKREGLNSYVFAHLQPEEKEALCKKRCKAIESLFSEAGLPL